MRTDALDYDLPADLIATVPADPRDAARLMVVDRATGVIEHQHVRDLPDLAAPAPGDLMVFNRSKVLPAFFTATRTATGGAMTGLYLGEDVPGHATDITSLPRWRVMLESRGKLKPGERVTLDDRASLTLLERIEAGEWLAELDADDTTLGLLSRIGSPPLPPYIRKARAAAGLAATTDDDVRRYNTVYAADPGSVAAPTAGLHFTPGLLAALDAKGVCRAEVTLHVGLGTFAPVRTDTLEDHDIHDEAFHISTDTLTALRNVRASGGRVVVVGTTSVRALESLPAPLPDVDAGPIDARTKLFITPDNGFNFRFTDCLLTNFHLPRSTLLAMVAALPGVGIEQLLTWYRTAIDQRYRFYSYGDAMLIV